MAGDPIELDRDFRALLRASVDHGVRFLVVGVYALAVLGRPRATGGLDVWIDASPENATRADRALQQFGAPLHELAAVDLATPGVVFQIGLPPLRIVVLTEISGIGFAAAWRHRLPLTFGDVSVHVISKPDFIQNERASGRLKDWSVSSHARAARGDRLGAAGRRVGGEEDERRHCRLGARLPSCKPAARSALSLRRPFLAGREPARRYGAGNRRWRERRRATLLNTTTFDHGAQSCAVRRVRTLRGCALLALAPLAFVVAACGTPADSTARNGPPPVAVEMTTVRTSSIGETVELVGQLEADESVVLKPETQGVIASVEFREGQEARRGDLLFRLRDEEQRARLAEAVAALSLAEEEYRRAQSLARQRTLSPAELDAATARLDAARARRDLAQVELDRTEIRAPFDGVLGARRVSPGDRVSEDTELVRIDALSRLRLAFTVPEIGVPLAKVGLPLEISVAAYPGERFPGEVYFVAPSLDPANRRLLLKAFVPNEGRRLRPGFFADVHLELAKHEDAIVVPESAIGYDARGTFVWRVDERNVAHRVPVELGIRREGRVEVTAGLGPGDRIVSAGTHKVADDAPVRPAESVVAADAASSSARATP
jgi:membrane fusion protein (multidrug efflux system)